MTSVEDEWGSRVERLETARGWKRATDGWLWSPSGCLSLPGVGNPPSNLAREVRSLVLRAASLRAEALRPVSAGSDRQKLMITGWREADAALPILILPSDPGQFCGPSLHEGIPVWELCELLGAARRADAKYAFGQLTAEVARTPRLMIAGAIRLETIRDGSGIELLTALRSFHDTKQPLSARWGSLLDTTFLGEAIARSKSGGAVSIGSDADPGSIFCAAWLSEAPLEPRQVGMLRQLAEHPAEAIRAESEIALARLGELALPSGENEIWRWLAEPGKSWRFEALAYLPVAGPRGKPDVDWSQMPDNSFELLCQASQAIRCHGWSATGT